MKRLVINTTSEDRGKITLTPTTEDEPLYENVIPEESIYDEITDKYSSSSQPEVNKYANRANNATGRLFSTIKGCSNEQDELSHRIASRKIEIKERSDVPRKENHIHMYRAKDTPAVHAVISRTGSNGAFNSLGLSIPKPTKLMTKNSHGMGLGSVKTLHQGLRMRNL